ncbi:MAG: hypothetical protein R6U94_04050 [Nitriliruptoraceae bacterium]
MKAHLRYLVVEAEARDRGCSTDRLSGLNRGGLDAHAKGFVMLGETPTRRNELHLGWTRASPHPVRANHGGEYLSSIDGHR